MYVVDGRYGFEKFRPKSGSHNAKWALLDIDENPANAVLKYSKNPGDYSAESELLKKITGNPSFPQHIYYNQHAEIRNAKKVLRGDVIIMTHVGECLIQSCTGLDNTDNLDYFLARVQDSALGLDYLHTFFNIIHSDIKKGHLTDNNGIGSIVDFNRCAREGEYIKTEYDDGSAPEQVNGGIWDRRTDVYGFGDYLLQAISNQGNTIPQAELIIPLIEKATHPLKIKRYQCMGELVEALSQVRRQLR